VAMHNLSSEPTATTLDLPSEEVDELVEIVSDAAYDPPKDGVFALEPYGYRWFRRGLLGP
jgi:hypothetical protein